MLKIQKRTRSGLFLVWYSNGQPTRRKQDSIVWFSNGFGENGHYFFLLECFNHLNTIPFSTDFIWHLNTGLVWYLDGYCTESQPFCDCFTYFKNVITQRKFHSKAGTTITMEFISSTRLPQKTS